ncbi:MAG: phospho-N-acetylmuramoyl-pentapeptide-transferase [Clostridia bacterium]|nr:Phospho-N-acetylmuramoyl-pentapeptide-transferase [Clostridiales bacterium]MDK2985625.1 phospho-N-acetylmuramoyl-pentapeptide-transferase [Clostridia bacterium]
MNLFFSFIVSCVVTLLLGPILIPFLRRLKFGQTVRNDGPRTHFSKTGTPTMGGLMFIFSTVLTTLFFAPHSLNILTVLAMMISFGAIGFADDYIKIVLKRSLGLRARSKLSLQILMSVILAVVAVVFLDRGTAIIIPLLGTKVYLHWLYIPFSIVVVVGTTNAVNLTDGLDGLAAGITFFLALVYIFITNLSNMPALGIFSCALAGGLAGFLFYNYHPASIFMGDTGSLALGAALATLAILTRTELLLVIIGGVYVIETLSVIMQVISFKLTGKRIFRMSPIHHHFELKGWKEKEVVLVFWIIAFIFAISGLGIFLIS